jgi:hypothetical protein
MTPEPPRGPSSQELAAALAVNAATKPFNIVAALVAFGVVLALGAPAILAVVAAIVAYTAAAARTMLNAAETARVTASVDGTDDANVP